MNREASFREKNQIKEYQIKLWSSQTSQHPHLKPSCLVEVTEDVSKSGRLQV